jgi:glycosyltransferase involved in cell wall biosynthesis
LALSVDRWLRIAADARLARRLKPLIEGTKCDVVHVNNTFTYQAATLLAGRQLRLPVVSHARNPVDPSLLNRHLLRFSDAVATVNRRLESSLKQWNTPVVVRTCYDGVEMPKPVAEKTVALRRWLAGHDGQLIGSVGRLDSQKGYHDLVKAARRVVDENPRVRLAIAGEGPFHESLARLIRELNLSEHVILLGFQADVASFLEALDVFVSSSHWEGLPIALVEAMLLAKPVVATDVGGCAELVTPGETGLLVPPGQPEQLASALLKQLTEKPRELVLDACRQRAKSLTDPQASARSLDELFVQTSWRQGAA